MADDDEIKGLKEALTKATAARDQYEKNSANFRSPHGLVEIERRQREVDRAQERLDRAEQAIADKARNAAEEEQRKNANEQGEILGEQLIVAKKTFGWFKASVILAAVSVLSAIGIAAGTCRSKGADDKTVVDSGRPIRDADDAAVLQPADDEPIPADRALNEYPEPWGDSGPADEVSDKGQDAARTSKRSNDATDSGHDAAPRSTR